MKATHRMQRFLAFALALVMLIGMLPMHSHAAEDSVLVDAAIIFTDLHTSKNDYKESTVKGIFGALKNTGLPFSSVTSGGDAFSVNEDSSSSNGPYTGDPTKITGYIQTALGTDIPVNYVWSDHDRYATGISKKSSLVEYDNYYIYLLSMGDLCSYDRYSAGFNYSESNNSGRVSAGFTATVPQAIAEFEAATENIDKSKPLFIVSHQPLFDNRNDNAWAEQWFDSINALAAEMDVAFFYGHNHKYDTGSDYYYAKGSSLPVATMDNWGWKYETGVGYKPSVDLGSENKVLNFTHMCAGYMEPTSTGSYSQSTTRSGTVMAITIYEDSIRYTTYNKNGIYTGNFAVDETVKRDHAVTEPELVVSGTAAYFVGSELDITVGYKTGSKVEDVTASAGITGFDMDAAGDYTVAVSYAGLTAEFPIQVRQKVFTDAATGVSVEVTVPGATALTVGAADAEAFDRVGAMLSDAQGYDIALEGFAEGNAVVTLPIPAGVDTPAVCHVDEDGTVKRVAIEALGGEASFSADSFGTFLIGQEEITEELENSVVGGTTVYEEKTVYVEADGFVNGGKYLVVGENKATNGDLIAYLNNSGSEGWTVVTPDADGCIELSNANAVWTASGSDSAGYTLTNNGYYIGGTDANTLKSSSSQAVKVKYDASAVRLKTASGTTRYLYYSTYGSENWKWSTSSSSSSSSRAIHLYKEETIRIPVSAPVTYTLTAENLHHVLATDTAALSFGLLADGVAAEESGDYRFEIKHDRSGIIGSIDETGVISFTGEIGSCYVKICCDLDAGTVYKYVKVSTEADPNACDHVYTAETVEATCTADGLITYTCVCGDSYTEVIPAKGHSYTAIVTAPTCTEAGYTTYTCACGEGYVADQVAALGHSYEAVKTEPTCTENGAIVYTCACGETYTEVIPAKGHSYTAIVTAPTCTEAGYTTYTCACGESYTADQVAALGHSYEAVKTEATCTEDGAIVYTCHCSETYTEVIPALGHSYEAVVTAPTCTEAGYTTYTCACGEGYVADEVAALGHTYETVVIAPTCTEGGCTTHTCACGDSFVTDETAALGHTYESVKTEATCTAEGATVYTCHCGHSYTTDVVPALGHELVSVVTEAACETAGYTTHTCARCGEVTVDGYVAALGHAIQVTLVEATCTTDGYRTELCERCGETETEVLRALGHTYASVKTEATCTEDGAIVYTCHCGETYTEVIPALGHKYESVVTAPTCTEDGYTTYTCACGERYITDEKAALGHSYEAVVTAPTCTEDGYTTYTCACGERYIADETAALGHSYEAVKTEPTCTEDGSMVYTCACGETYTEVIPALGHKYESVVTAPTCTEGGCTTHTCACGDSYVTDVTDALGHSYTSVEEDGWMVYTCTRCGHSYSEKLVTTYDQVSAFTAGDRFVVTIKSGSKYYALSHKNNSLSAVQVTVSNGQITSEVTEELLWSYNDGKLSYVTDGTTRYLYTYTSGWWFWSTTELGISTSESANVSISGTKLKIGSVYLRYSSSKLSVSSSAGTAYIFCEN